MSVAPALAPMQRVTPLFVCLRPSTHAVKLDHRGVLQGSSVIRRNQPSDRVAAHRGAGLGDVPPGGNGVGVVVVGLELPHPAARLTVTNKPANLSNNDVRMSE